MEVIILLLGIALVVITLIPTTEEIEEFKRKSHCDIHKWVSKPNNIDDGTYTVCENCKFLPGSDNYEQ